MKRDHDPLDDTLGSLVRPRGAEKKPTLMGFLRTRMITGALVSLPLVVTIFFARFLFNLLDRWSYPISTRLVGYPLPGVGAVLAIVLVFVIGLLAHNVLGRRILRLGESVISRVPVLRSVYLGTREVTKAFSGDRTKNFRRVVLVPFPVENAYVVGFLTAEFEAMTPQGRERVGSVFFPTTPNPTTGFYLIYPMRMIHPSDLTVEDAVRLVISGGLLAPDPRRIFGERPPAVERLG
ncbi:MAG: DUF502 domain-containing protein [Acidobacteriota bacterium]